MTWDCKKWISFFFKDRSREESRIMGLCDLTVSGKAESSFSSRLATHIAQNLTYLSRHVLIVPKWDRRKEMISLLKIFSKIGLTKFPCRYLFLLGRLSMVKTFVWNSFMDNKLLRSNAEQVSAIRKSWLSHRSNCSDFSSISYQRLTAVRLLFHAWCK